MFTKLSSIYEMPLKVYYNIYSSDQDIIKERIVIEDGDYACFEDSPHIKIDDIRKASIDGTIIINYRNLNNNINGNLIYFLSYNDAVNYLTTCYETEISDFETEIESRRKKIASLNEEGYIYDTGDIISAVSYKSNS